MKTWEVWQCLVKLPCRKGKGEGCHTSMWATGALVLCVSYRHTGPFFLCLGLCLSSVHSLQTQMLLCSRETSQDYQSVNLSFVSCHKIISHLQEVPQRPKEEAGRRLAQPGLWESALGGSLQVEVGLELHSGIHID